MNVTRLLSLLLLATAAEAFVVAPSSKKKKERSRRMLPSSPNSRPPLLLLHSHPEHSADEHSNSRISSSTLLYSTLPTNPSASHQDELLEHLDEVAPVHLEKDNWMERVLETYWGPRLLLGVLAAVYATNFPLGALMNDSLPASAATSARMVVASLALSPFVLELHKDLRVPAVLCGCFTASGYITQSLALLDVDPAKVSFLGSATVLVCPLLEWAIDQQPRGLREAPQTWLAALLSLTGVGVLELYDPSTSSMGILDHLTHVSAGDGLALLQAVGFGTGVFWTSRMLRDQPDQALPVTATLIATTAAVSSLWCLVDGWMFQDDWFHLTLPGILLHSRDGSWLLAGAVLWTGLVSTSLNFFIELTALGRVPPSEASVLLASEPLWAAVFASMLYHTSLSASDWLGGSMLLGACLVNALVTPELLGMRSPSMEETTVLEKQDERLESKR